MRAVRTVIARSLIDLAKFVEPVKSSRIDTGRELPRSVLVEITAEEILAWREQNVERWARGIP